MFVKFYSLCLVAIVVSEVECYHKEEPQSMVAEANLLKILPINRTILEGEEATFECLPKDPELKINWFKDGILLSEFNTLIIRNTTVSDHGEYECEVRFDNGDIHKAKAFLDVQYKAKVVFAPSEVLLQYGEPGLIDCHFEANPPLANIRWDKDGVVFDPYNMESVFYCKNGSLYITKADERHNGRYTCTPFNNLGSEGPSPSMLVIVQRPPVFVVTPLYVYLRKLGDEITLPCSAKYGDVVWSKKGGLSLPEGRYSIKEDNLTIRNIQKEDEATYQCSASNQIAAVTAETDLLVEDPPISVPLITLTADSSVSSVTVMWLLEKKRLNNVKFVVWYKPVGSTDWKSRNVPSSTLKLVVSGLSADTEYDFMVVSMGSDETIFSKTIRVKTKEN